MSDASRPFVGIIMGSRSDWPETMAHAAETLEKLGVPYETRVVSAHRTPDLLFEYASSLRDKFVCHLFIFPTRGTSTGHVSDPTDPIHDRLIVAATGMHSQ